MSKIWRETRGPLTIIGVIACAAYGWAIIFEQLARGIVWMFGL